jgi:hypothetical protein
MLSISLDNKVVEKRGVAVPPKVHRYIDEKVRHSFVGG